MLHLSGFKALYLLLWGCSAWNLWLILPNFVVSTYRSFSCAAVVAALAYYCYPILRQRVLSNKITPIKKAVFITGCASGFGYEFAKRLDSKGYQVFASCRSIKGENVEKLKASCSERLHVLELDVTKDESIARALKYVKDNLNDCCLWAVINNAGVHLGFDICWSDMYTFEKTLEVNAIGPIRVVKAFLPLLKQSQGRVVTVASILGRFCLGHNAPYTMSKYSAVSFSECLDQELKISGVRAFNIEPSFFKTPFMKHVTQNLEELDSVNKEVFDLYGREHFIKTKYSVSFLVENIASRDYSVVIDCMDDVITLENPSVTTYRIQPKISFIIENIFIWMPVYVIQVYLHYTFQLMVYPIFRNVSAHIFKLIYN